jgi:hypothetical protein
MGKRGKRRRREKRRGKRMALVIGLDYPGTEDELDCAVLNATREKNTLVKHLKFHNKNVVLMTDRDASSVRKVTAEDVAKQLSKMIKNGKKGDVIMMYFCGHGSWFKPRKYMNNSGFVEMMEFNNNTCLPGWLNLCLINLL